MFSLPTQIPNGDRLNHALRTLGIGKPKDVTQADVVRARKFPGLRNVHQDAIAQTAAVNDHIRRRPERLRESLRLLEAVRTLDELPKPARLESYPAPYIWQARGVNGVGYCYGAPLGKEVADRALIIDAPAQFLDIRRETRELKIDTNRVVDSLNDVIQAGTPKIEAHDYPTARVSVEIGGDVNREISAHIEAIALVRLDGRPLVEFLSWDGAALGVVVDSAVLNALIDQLSAKPKKGVDPFVNITFA